MKACSIAVAAALSALSVPTFATDVGVSISIGEPGFYGRIDIGGYPPPVLVYREPILIERVTVHRAPIYLHVPPGHAKNWGRYCHEYRACGERVYFVRDEWYDREYVPRYRERHGAAHGRDGDRGHGGGDDKHAGQGKDHGKGHGHGNKD
jgi:hypothetical protein